ncbi:hypothetical protein SAMN05444392_10362 [Seinonella peptonophila]|uniref:Uncharacterized protein n=1 Tax=Seinonella peptonophila TaxID=112248 RepID=A0A1M4W6J6_9BACL|nr:hypothetical protein SAMN05444392_10362 [Seinonella peptonophila]
MGLRLLRSKTSGAYAPAKMGLPISMFALAVVCFTRASEPPLDQLDSGGELAVADLGAELADLVAELAVADLGAELADLVAELAVADLLAEHVVQSDRLVRGENSHTITLGGGDPAAPVLHLQRGASVSGTAVHLETLLQQLFLAGHDPTPLRLSRLCVLLRRTNHRNLITLIPSSTIVKHNTSILFNNTNNAINDG